MISPHLIPKGMVQEYNESLGQWRVRNKQGIHPTNGYALEELYLFPEIGEKLYSIQDHILP